MKTAFLFPGQGTQSVGMGKDLYDHINIYRQTFDICEAGAGIDLRAACFEGARMDESEVAQPAIFAHTISLLSTVQNEGIDADIVAGLSLGEYSAMTAAGVFEADLCATLVRKRGRIMDDAFPKGTGGMLSVIGFTVLEVEDAIKDYSDAYVANHLSELQSVVAAKTSDLLALKEVFEQKGAKLATLLNVNGPSHAPLLSAAADEFLHVLENVNLGMMRKTVYSNALGKPYSQGGDVKKLLANQMCSRVRWHECIEHMIASGVERYVEIGPSNVLSKLLKRRVKKGVEVVSVRDLPTLERFFNKQ
ncbi:MAG: ACP S-malonyltransferase [Christensenellales bacterium]